MPANEPGGLLADFEAGRVDPAQFPHRAHVEVSYELLERHPFPEALLHLARGLRGLATKDGRKPAKSRKFFICSFALLAGALVLFFYPLKFVPPGKRGEVAFGLALAMGFLSVVAFLFWKTVKFLNADTDRTENEEDDGPPPE